MKDLISYHLLEKKRKQLSQLKHLPSELKDYLSAPLVKPNTPIGQIEFLVLDFETTGLDIKKDRIVSLGYTLIKDLHIVLSESRHIVVNPKQTMDEKNVTIHELTDDEVSQGVKVSRMMQHLLSIMKGRVLVVHFDQIERNFINKCSAQLYGVDTLPFQLLDTLKIESNKRRKIQNFVDGKSLRLFNLIEQYNLPRYKAHHAMQDAISTAELFLAQVAAMGKNSHSKFKELL